MPKAFLMPRIKILLFEYSTCKLAIYIFEVMNQKNRLSSCFLIFSFVFSGSKSFQHRRFPLRGVRGRLPTHPKNFEIFPLLSDSPPRKNLVPSLFFKFPLPSLSFPDHSPHLGKKGNSNSFPKILNKILPAARIFRSTYLKTCWN